MAPRLTFFSAQACHSFSPRQSWSIAQIAVGTGTVACRSRKCHVTPSPERKVIGRDSAIGCEGRPAGSAASRDPAQLAALPDDALLEVVQRQTFRYFWEGAHPDSGWLAFDRRTSRKRAGDTVSIGGSGFGVMALIVAAERGWITRAEALERLGRMLDLLLRARCYHGAYPHFMDGRTGDTIPFWRKDDAGHNRNSQLASRRAAQSARSP